MKLEKLKRIIKSKLVIFLFLFSCFYTSAQEKYTLSGTISDSNSNETLIGVTVFIPELKTGVLTNEYGFYSITLPKGKYSIRINYSDYQNLDEVLELNQNLKINCVKFK